MGNLVNCPTCGKPIASDAKTCPHCGKLEPNALTLSSAAVIGVLLLGAFLYFFLREHDSAPPRSEAPTGNPVASAPMPQSAAGPTNAPKVPAQKPPVPPPEPKDVEREREQQAQSMLDEAVGLEAKGQADQAKAKYEELLAFYGGTKAAEQAQKHIAQMQREAAAQKLLNLAKNWEANRQVETAKAKYEEVIEQYRGTKAAGEATTLLDALKGK